MRRVIGFLAIAGLWEVAARVSSSPLMIPVSGVVTAFWRLMLSGELPANAMTSLGRVSLGFLLASVSGILLGVLIYLYKPIEDMVMPVVDAIRPVAALTIFPLIILALGLGLASKVFVIFWTAWPACLLNTVQGLRDVDKQVIEAARLDGAGTFTLLVSMYLPLSFPTLLTGLRIGLSGGWISLVAAEMLGSQSGLGWAILSYSNTFRFPDMYATIVAIAIIGLLMNVGLASIPKILHSDTEEHHNEKIDYSIFLYN